MNASDITIDGQIYKLSYFNPPRVRFPIIEQIIDECIAVCLPHLVRRKTITIQVFNERKRKVWRFKATMGFWSNLWPGEWISTRWGAAQVVSIEWGGLIHAQIPAE